MKRSLLSTVPLAVLVLAGLVLSACGVRVDDEPRTFGLDRDLSDKPTTTAPPLNPQGTIYLTTTDAGVEKLVEQGVDVAVPVSDEEGFLRATLESLIEFKPEPSTDGTPAAQNFTDPLTLEDVEINGTTARLTFSGLEDLQGQGQTMAIAQIVFTATARSDIVDKVIFQAARDDIVEEVQVGIEGATARRGDQVERADFPKLLRQLLGLEPETTTTTSTTAPPPPTEGG